MEEIKIDEITQIKDYPVCLKKFVKKNNLKLPSLKSGNGKALSVMTNNPKKYFTRESCDNFIKKFNINSKDSIQLFNKHEQRGFSQSKEKGKYYIKYPYKLSNKFQMRKNFKNNYNTNEKIYYINLIKKELEEDYIKQPNNKWQLGHKNPDINDNTINNCILQPPKQGCYRDDYIYINQLIVFPTPNKLNKLFNSKKIQFSLKQVKDYIKIFEEIKKNNF